MSQAPAGSSIKRDVVVIGASAGGVEALISLFKGLPPDLPAAVAVVLHRHPLFNIHLAKVLGRGAALPLVEVREDGPFQQGTIYIAPSDAHLLLTSKGVRPDRGPKEHFTRPAVDPLFRTAADVFGQRTVGVLLTGGGDDGTRGLINIKAADGISIIQNPDEARASSMPRNALLYDHVDLVLPLQDMASAIVALAHGTALHRFVQGRRSAAPQVSEPSTMLH
ncbi:MAG TPA: chemotaxis protein CheB [Nitrospiraceae bacterium]|nr:chemotaxis protein CheB [Nitrospiraceae bacterium]